MRWVQLGRILALGALSLLVAGSSLAAYLALDRGEAFRAGGLRFALAHGFERGAERALVHQPRPLSFMLAERQSRQALALSPYNNMPRIRLAYLEWAKAGELSPTAAAALSQSYELSAYDHEAADWRMRLALENWSALTPELQAAVRNEALAFGKVRRKRTIAALRAVQDPAGRFAAGLLLRQMPGKPALAASQ